MPRAKKGGTAVAACTRMLGLMFSFGTLFTGGLPAEGPFPCDGIAPASGAVLRAERVSALLSSPVDLQAPPGDTERIFVVEQAGRIRIIRLDGDVLLPAAFLDIAARVEDGGEKGLLGLAFHPRYSENGFFFVNYTRAPGSVCEASPPAGCPLENEQIPRNCETVVARYQVSAGDPDRADPDSETILLSFCQPYSNHKGGQIAFGPADDYLYIATGDGGSGGDPCNSGQNPLSLLGKILRIDVDSEEPPYGIPPTNPFAGRADVRGEVWALGVRNPWRCSFDPLTGDFYIADVGQGTWEEVDFQPGSSSGGRNYEWHVREGDHSFSPGTSYGPGTRVAPIIEYPHNDPVSSFEGCSITGGVVYRGCRMPDLHGTYFFADHCRHWVRSFRLDSGAVVDLRDRTTELNAGIAGDVLDEISSFGVDGRGEVYICDLGTKLFRIVPADPTPILRVFVRGNVNGDDLFDLSDAIFTLKHLFLGDPPQVACADALDANDDGDTDIADPVYTLLRLFSGGSPPPPPHPDCDRDPTSDAVNCAASTCG